MNMFSAGQSAPRSVAVHLGVNSVLAKNYAGYTGRLSFCENDATTMATISAFHHFGGKPPLTGSAATAAAVEAEIVAASMYLHAGDFFLLTMAGHGAQIPSLDSDEPYDQTWCLYDRMLIDNEIYDLLAKFDPGVRVVVVSDTCHAGSDIERVLAPNLTPQETQDIALAQSRVLPDSFALQTYLQNDYRSIQLKHLRRNAGPIRAFVVLMAACLDDEEALELRSNGLFTANLSTVWNSGTFNRDYQEFVGRIRGRVKATNPRQHPSLFPLGPTTNSPWGNSPFII